MPYFLAVIAGHRWQFIDTPSLFVLLGLGILLILIALGLGAIGLFQLWHFGYLGGMRSVRGIILATIMFVPYAQSGWLAFSLPILNDITTDRIAPPAYQAALGLRRAGMNEIDPITDSELEQQENAYPLIGPRRYATSSDRVFAAVTDLMERQGWRIIAEDIPQNTDSIDIGGSVRKNGEPRQVTVPDKRPDEPSLAGDTNSPAADSGEREPDDDLNVAYVEAVVRSLIFGFPDDVIVRIIEEEEFVLVDMRSSSRWGQHDLGVNAVRIISFFNELDKSLVGIAGEG